jgi:hypothetical protein
MKDNQSGNQNDNQNDKQDDPSKDWPKTFKDGEFGFVKAVLLGGPFDGRRYTMTRFPDGSVPSGTASPLQQPHETSPYAHYERAGDEVIGGYYVFIYTETRGPNGERMAEETPETTEPTTVPATATETTTATAPVSSQPGSQTCAGYGFAPQHPVATDPTQPPMENS